MKKLVVFNVGGALSTYMDINGIKIIADIGKSADFNPVTDFLIPLASRNNFTVGSNGKFVIDQLIISHPHEDHISAIEDFNDNFYPELLTCPNDKPDNNPRDILDFTKFDENSTAIKRLRTMYKNRNLPLTTKFQENSGDKQFLFWIKPQDVEDDENLSSNGEAYQNNVSLVSMFEINGYWVLLPGDIMKNGMSRLINAGAKFFKKLSIHGIDILVAPHHGLQSSFSTHLFDTIYGHKTRCLNIISEKPNNENENRNVDTRYFSEEYCDGNNNLVSTNSEPQNYGRRTSNGHICIDFENTPYPKIKIINDANELLDWFYK